MRSQSKFLRNLTRLTELRNTGVPKRLRGNAHPRQRNHFSGHRKSFLVLVSSFIFLLTLIVIGTFQVKAQATVLSLEPSNNIGRVVNETLTINLTINNVENLWGWQVKVSWDASVLTLLGYPTEGEFLESAGATSFVSEPERGGSLHMICTLLSDEEGSTGSGILATLTFMIQKETVESSLDLIDSTLQASGTDHALISHQTQNATVSLIIGNKPVAYADIDPIINEDTPVVLNGSRSLIPEGENVTFTWSVYNRELQIVHGMIASYVFDIPGSYNITLTVEDSLGDQSNDTVHITVIDITPPVPIIEIDNLGQSQPRTIDINVPITFNGSQSYDPEGGRIQTCLWDLGDGTKITGELAGPHQYANTGTYTVNLTIVDDTGKNVASEIVTVDIVGTRNILTNLPPISTGILAVITILAVCGSTTWLRKVKRTSKEPSQ